MDSQTAAAWIAAAVASIAALVAIWQALSASRQASLAEDQADAAKVQALEAVRATDAATEQVRLTQVQLGQTRHQYAMARVEQLRIAFYSILAAANRFELLIYQVMHSPEDYQSDLNGNLQALIYTTPYRDPFFVLLRSSIPADSLLAARIDELAEVSRECADQATTFVFEWGESPTEDYPEALADADVALSRIIADLDACGRDYFAGEFRRLADETEQV